MYLKNLLKATEQQWENSNPILKNGEYGYAYDSKILKVGNGIDSWSDLSNEYFPSVNNKIIKKYQEELKKCHIIIQEKDDDTEFPAPKEGEN